MRYNTICLSFSMTDFFYCLQEITITKELQSMRQQAFILYPERWQWQVAVAVAGGSGSVFTLKIFAYFKLGSSDSNYLQPLFSNIKS